MKRVVLWRWLCRRNRWATEWHFDVRACVAPLLCCLAHDRINEVVQSTWVDSRCMFLRRSHAICKRAHVHLMDSQGGTEQTLRVRVTLTAPCTAAARRELGPVSAQFEVPMYSVSGLQVRRSFTTVKAQSCTNSSQQQNRLYVW
jgi:hypothetical protein